MMNTRLIPLSGLLLPLLLGACTTITDTFSSDKVNYKTASDAPKRDALEVPPDLSTLPKDDHFNMPDSKPGSTTASNYEKNRSAVGTTAAVGPTVLPVVKDAHMERAGGQRWLVVSRTPDQLWPVLRDFWQENGFLLKIESPETGIMETDWAENQAKLPLDFVRKTLGKVLDSIYDTGERDKFRTRLERRSDGGTEIYISHRGMVEVVTSQQNQTTVWTQRPSDPELEAEFLRRLLVRLGSDQATARTIVATSANGTSTVVAASTESARAHIVGSGAASYVQIDDAFDRAWRRVGLALDRVNFTVEDRDRAQGTYFVRYVDPASDTKEKPGLLSRIFSSDDKSKLALQYRILVKGQPDNATSRVSVLNKDGQPEAGDASARILALLTDQLK